MFWKYRDNQCTYGHWKAISYCTMELLISELSIIRTKEKHLRRKNTLLLNNKSFSFVLIIGSIVQQDRYHTDVYIPYRGSRILR